MIRTVFAVLVAALAVIPSTAAERPNVVLVLADDLGLGDLACYGGTTPTPHLDRMTRDGIRFTHYYSASPICSPSRCGIVTGQFPGRWRITSYRQTRAGNTACGQADFLGPAAPSLPRVLKDSGYRTAHISKWHLGGGRDVAEPPKFARDGYDLGLGTWESPEPHSDLTARDWIWSAVDRVKRWDRTRWMVDRTLDFLAADPTRPCFVNLWLDDPHTPWVPSAEDQQLGKNGRPSGKGDTPERLAKVLTEMDTQVGRLLDAVRKAKTGRPTVVLFLSDNGPLPTFGRSRASGLRGSKLSLYEGGIRVPCIAWGPGIVPVGLTNDTTVLSSVDWLPTLCRLCEAKLPSGYAPDGEDLSPALLGKSPRRTRPLFWETFDNRSRRHSTLGYVSPEEYEAIPSTLRSRSRTTWSELASLDLQTPQSALAIRCHGNFGREPAVANGLFILVALALLKVVGFDAKLEPAGTNKSPSKVLATARRGGAELLGTPVFAVRLRHESDVNNPAGLLTLPIWRQALDRRRSPAEFVAEDDVLAAYKVARIQRHDANEDGVAGQ